MLKNKYNILLVDDEEDNLALLNRTLRQDFGIFQTTSALEALEILKNNPIDIIISDHKMPEIDGVEFLRRSCEIKPECVRLLVTAYSDSNILINAINHGKVYQYIKKPWEPSDLLITLKSAVEYRQLKIENDRLIYDLKELFSGTVNAIIEALDAKDSFTLGKSRRVTFFSVKMAMYFNLSNENLGKLELAGLLHDIGMIGIPEEILNKADTLNLEEVEAIKKHVTYGVRILEDIKQLKDVVEIIKFHHERYDGSGYPYGIKGEEIPLISKIISIADTYDSMTSNRSYRKSLSHEEALAKLEEQSGKQFDPVIVEAFKSIIGQALNEIQDFERQLAEQI